MRHLSALFAAACLACPAGALADSFYELCDKAQASNDPAVQVELYTQALGVWMPADTEANRAMVYNNRAISYQTLKQYDKSLADYNASLGIAPRDAATLENRATVLESLNRPAAALSDYDRALSIDSNRPKAYRNRAQIYITKGDFAQALRNLNRALSAAPHDALALNLRAGVHERLRDNDSALADYKTAMAEAPADPAPWVNRGLLLKSLRQTGQAVADFVWAAELYRRLKMPELEMTELERAVKTSPSSARANAARGAAFLLRGRLSEAEADALKAASIKSKDPGGEVLLGRLSIERGDLDSAGRFFEAALVIKADDTLAQLGQAFVAFKLGKLDAARSRFKQAVAISPRLAKGQDGAADEGYVFTAKETVAFKALSQAP